MPSVEQTKLNKGALVALLFIVLIVGELFLPIPWWAKAVIALALVAVFLYLRRGYLYFYRAAVLLQKENSPKVWNLMKKALKAKIDDERKVLICSAFIQQGDAQFGIETLEHLIETCKDKSRRATAIVTLSMGYWRIGQLDEAIKLLQNLKDTGYNDENLEINLETYLLEKGDLKEAKKLINQWRKNGTESNGLLDNRGWYYIQTGSWEKASEVFDELINERQAKFPEAYVHGAQVSIHQGKIDDALDRLGWALSKRFTKTCSMTKEYIQALINGLENHSTRDAFAKAIDNHAREVALGLEFLGFELSSLEFSSQLSSIQTESPIQPIKTDAFENTKPYENCFSESCNEEDDDREPNTDLTDEDLYYENDEETEEDSYGDEGFLDTSVDDDDREPNTELTEEDEKITE